MSPVQKLFTILENDEEFVAPVLLDCARIFAGQKSVHDLAPDERPSKLFDWAGRGDNMSRVDAVALTTNIKDPTELFARAQLLAKREIFEDFIEFILYLFGEPHDE